MTAQDMIKPPYAERREVAFGDQVEAVTVAGLRLETGGLA